MDRWVNRVAVVTGAGSGNGAACARRLLEACIQVVGLDKNIKALDEFKAALPPKLKPRFHCQKCNVSHENDVKENFHWIETELGGADILLNNAGILRPGNLVDMPLQPIKDTINVNVMSTIYCTQKALQSMLKRNYPGHLLFISSTAGLSGYTPGLEEESLNAYTPSKVAVTAINQICRTELIRLKSKVKTTNISPGWVKTPMAKGAAAKLKVFLYPEDVADAVMYALSTPPHAQVEQITLRAVGEWS